MKENPMKILIIEDDINECNEFKKCEQKITALGLTP